MEKDIDLKNASKISQFVTNKQTKKSLAFDMLHVEAGCFDMEGYEGQGENPPKKVNIGQPFLMGETLVTQDLYELVMGFNPSQYCDNMKKPVEHVTWFDCADFCNKLSKLQGLNPYYSIKDVKKRRRQSTLPLDVIDEAVVKIRNGANGYRLPTEAEWEYAAKAGCDFMYSGSNSLEDVAVVRGIGTYEVKTRKPNAWGFYDMSGNTQEWCSDIRMKKRQSTDEFWHPIWEWCRGKTIEWEEVEIVVRGGGSCVSIEETTKCTRRNAYVPNYFGESIGIRLVRDF